MQGRRLTSKHLLLLAALTSAFAAPAMAQTNVTVSGLLDSYIGSLRYAGDTARTTVLGTSGMTTSWFGVQGTEDLGGGLKANFALASFIRVDTGQSGRFPGNETMWSRDAHVGLSGNFGAVSIGHDLAPHFLPMILSNPFADSFTFSPLNVHMDVPLFNASGWTSTVTGDTGWSNEIVYTTPSLGGLTANLHYELGEVPGNSGLKNVGMNVLYFRGPLSLTAFYHNVKANNPLNTPVGNVQPGGNIPLPSGQFAARQTAWMVGGGYDFTAVKLFATYGQTSHDIDFEDKTVSLGASAPLGSGKLLAAWAQTKRDGAAIGADLKRNTASLGYDYDLSKRTDLYTVLMNDKITNRNSGNSFAMGLRHRF
jgi:predicted porin